MNEVATLWKSIAAVAALQRKQAYKERMDAIRPTFTVHREAIPKNKTLLCEDCHEIAYFCFNLEYATHTDHLFFCLDHCKVRWLYDDARRDFEERVNKK